MKVTAVTIYFTSLMYISNAFADTTPDILDDMLGMDDIPIILTATRLKQSKLEAPLATSIIDKETIDRTHARTLTELFRLVPGFIAGSRDGRSTLVTNFGFADGLARNFQVLVDGKSVWSVSVGGVPWHDLGIEVEDIERIEIIRGPNAATYGSNSFLGTINIITSHTDATTGNLAKLKIGSNEYRNVYFRTGKKIDNIGYRLTLSDREDTGFKAKNETADTDGQTNTVIKSRVDWQLNEKDALDFDLGFVDGTRRDGAENANPFDPIREKQLDYNYQKVRWHRAWNEDDALKLTVYTEYHKQTDVFTTGDIAVPFPPGSVTLDIDSTVQWKRESLELEFRKRLSDSVRTVLGVEKRKDSFETKIHDRFDGWAHNDIARGFARIEYKPKQSLILNAGLMQESVTAGGDKTSPMIAATYLLDETSSIRTSLSRAFRYPVAYEEYAYTAFFNGALVLIDTTGNLSPAKIDAFDIGYFKNNKENHIQYEARIFYMDMNDLIMPTKTNGINDFLNTDNATLYGVQGEINYHPGPDTRILANFSLQNTTATDIADNISDSVPKTGYGVTVLQNFNDGFDGTLSFNHLSEMAYQVIDPVPEFNRLDISLRKKVKIGAKNTATFLIQALNILDDHKDVRPENDIGRLYYLSGQIEF